MVWVVVWGEQHAAAAAPDENREAVPVAPEVAALRERVWLVKHPVFVFAGMYHRIAEYIGYTFLSPAYHVL